MLVLMLIIWLEMLEWVKGLMVGVDDYFGKLFDCDELFV